MKNKANTIKQAIDQFIDHYNLRYKFDERQIVEAWEEIAGKMICKHTTNLYLKDKKLHVEVRSSVAKQELLFIKSRLIKHINKKLNKEVTDEIIVH